ncbi:hypothetical protein Cgig2_033412 [Carnegiea gigantea]|uniref:Uncharacterized protein n=1 Tax=Carnegiea gigantea TaxID=171969 RepID=A0A9Q1KVA7_9CARY|nr:hypothetical protein Cgig2_033412 [Carnegiea gigantea]
MEATARSQKSSSDNSNEMLSADGDEKAEDDAELLEDKISSNICVMPIILNRINECISRIHELVSSNETTYAVLKGWAFSKAKEVLSSLSLFHQSNILSSGLHINSRFCFAIEIPWLLQTSRLPVGCGPMFLRVFSPAIWFPDLFDEWQPAS